ncbi:MAG: hypothetical protein ACI8W8_003020 [Rhodothermales bacterium]|jgi:hypothetical protein
MMRILIFFLAMAGMAGERQIFLLIGQSNMAGRAAVPEEWKGEVAGVSLWNGGAWEAAVPPYNRYATQRKKIFTGLNPGPSFAKAWCEANPDQEIGIVCAARGGTRIGQWRAGPSSMPLYDSAIAATKAALAGGGTLAGILWHQGESNSKNPDAYPAALAELCARLRADLKQPDLPIVFGQIGAWRAEYATFNEMITKQAAKIANTACVTTEDLANKDAAHFNSEGQIGLGKRYAKAMQRLHARR